MNPNCLKNFTIAPPSFNEVLQESKRLTEEIRLTELAYQELKKVANSFIPETFELMVDLLTNQISELKTELHDTIDKFKL